jgi:hypothetical protein
VGGLVSWVVGRLLSWYVGGYVPRDMVVMFLAMGVVMLLGMGMATFRRIWMAMLLGM